MPATQLRFTTPPSVCKDCGGPITNAFVESAFKTGFFGNSYGYICPQCHLQHGRGKSIRYEKKDEKWAEISA